MLTLFLNRAGAADLSSADIAAAKRLYNLKCAKCHKFYDPAAYGKTEWDTWMKKMARKSKLKADQYELLSRYLETFRNPTKSSSK